VSWKGKDLRGAIASIRIFFIYLRVGTSAVVVGKGCGVRRQRQRGITAHHSASPTFPINRISQRAPHAESHEPSPEVALARSCTMFQYRRATARLLVSTRKPEKLDDPSLPARQTRPISPFPPARTRCQSCSSPKTPGSRGRTAYGIVHLHVHDRIHPRDGVVQAQGTYQVDVARPASRYSNRLYKPTATGGESRDLHLPWGDLCSSSTVRYSSVTVAGARLSLVLTPENEIDTSGRWPVHIDGMQRRRRASFSSPPRSWASGSHPGLDEGRLTRRAC
jgi:hypothetical protein